MIVAIAVAALATSFLSGIFGMIGGLVLMGVLLLFLPVPIKAKWFVLIYGAVELLFGVTQTMPNVAHFAHLGGLLFGAGVLWRWGWRPGMTWKF